MEYFRRHRGLSLLLAIALGSLTWACLAPIRVASRDFLFEIPKGTWARRQAGDKVDLLPSQVVLTLGVRDVLLLRNSDVMPQIFGPVVIKPGQDFRLPFSEVSETRFDCTAQAGGQMTVVVHPLPNPGLARLNWRLAALGQAIRTY